MIIDSHYHLQEPMESIAKLLSHMQRLNIGRVALIPAMNSPFTVDWLIRATTRPTQMALNGKWSKLALGIYGSTVTSSGRFIIGIHRYTIYDKPDNESIAQVLQNHKDKFFGWILVNPNIGDPIIEVNKWMGQSGWIGIKAHPFMHRYAIEKLDSIAAYCSDKRLPMLIHLGTTRERGDYRYLPDKYPMLKVIYAHAGLPYFSSLWNYAKGKKNVFVDLSCSLLDRSILIGAIRALGSNRCLYGSDSPYGYPGPDGSHDYGRVLDNIDRLPISEPDKNRIWGDNFTELISN
jgi:predicted TIM-barrel fold metal-dependent hydrolase